MDPLLDANGIPIFQSTIKNSLGWRLWHSINYMLGGILFVLGSICYYPFVNTFMNGSVWGGWLFTVGSTNFLLADITEWNHFKFGCLVQPSKNKIRDDSLLATFRRAEMGLNFFASVIGSTLYLVGSIFFIPATNMLLAGEDTFIVGSLIIFFSQLWKCLRTLATNEEDPNDNSMKCSNIKYDTLGFFVDLWAGIGGLFYTIGTWLFANVVSDSDLIWATSVFVCGGASFAISGICMQIRYYQYKEENVQNNNQELNYIPI